MVQLVRHPQTKERDTDRLHLNHRATSRLYPNCGTPARVPGTHPFEGTVLASRKGSRILGMIGCCQRRAFWSAASRSNPTFVDELARQHTRVLATVESVTPCGPPSSQCRS